ncbi:MAG: phospholipid carrier-dependent glycosyltransferase [bacterium]|nr:phospholipid carrier-dependent glycosyltransferase [bacterium]
MNRTKFILVFILLFAAVTRLWNLGYPKGYYFDEVYNAFTTRELVKNNRDAYEWSHQSPVQGTAYGWTHPPLAKLMAAVGILTFGDNEFGWRVVNALVGVGIIYLVYWLGKNLLRSEPWALLAAGLASLDGLLLAQSRINMNDIVATFFVLLVFAAFVRYQLHKSKISMLIFGISLGLLIATKWTGFYALAVFAPWLGLQNLTRVKLWPKLFAVLIVIPVAIYFLSYSQYFILGGTLSNFWELQKQMWWYNTRLTATHTYQSLWWTWPLDLRPVWYFVDYSVSGKMANIYAMGNPVLFWLGIPAIIATTLSALQSKNWRTWLIVVGFGAFWLPWARAPRIMFLYHYLPSIPFLCLALAQTLSKLPRWATVASGLLVFGSFVFFFPHWTGIHIPAEWAKNYFWLSSWK